MHGCFRLTAQEPTLDDPVAIIHPPRTAPKKYSLGNITQVYTTAKLFDYSAHIYGGSSGAPVVSLWNAKDQVIGLHVSGTELPGDQRIPDHKHHYAVPIRAILQSAYDKKEQWGKVLIFLVHLLDQ